MYIYILLINYIDVTDTAHRHQRGVIGQPTESEGVGCPQPQSLFSHINEFIGEPLIALQVNLLKH